MLQAGKSLFRAPYPSNRSMALRLSQPLTEMSTRECFWGVERGRFVRLTISPPSVSRLCGQCGIHNILQLSRHPRPATGKALFYFTLLDIHILRGGRNLQDEQLRLIEYSL
jgi:hypothetical protein